MAGMKTTLAWIPGVLESLLKKGIDLYQGTPEGMSKVVPAYGVNLGLKSCNA